MNESTPKIVERKCSCGTDYQAVEMDLFGQLYYRPFACPPCVERSEADKVAEEQRQKQKGREDKWNAVCPPLYRDTDLSHTGLSRAAVDCVRRWDMKRGIGLIGESGRGKTRVLFVALRRAHEAGKFVRVVSHNRFSKIVIEAFSGDGRAESGKELMWLRKTDYLMIDDLGKAPSTERADAEMEELIEYRVSNDLPILWSANAAGGWLENRFGPDRGPALVRRLAQFCECITV